MKETIYDIKENELSNCQLITNFQQHLHLLIDISNAYVNILTFFS